MDAGALTALAERARAGDLEADLQLTAQAASGDIVAQRAILGLLLGDEPASITFEQAIRLEMLARFVALRSALLVDGRRYALIHWVLARGALDRGDEQGASFYAEECAKTLRVLIDGGDGIATDNFAAFAAEFPEAWAATEDESTAPVPDAAPSPPIICTNLTADSPARDRQ